MLYRVLGLITILILSLGVSGCSSCGKLDQFNTPTMPKLCHADTPPG